MSEIQSNDLTITGSSYWGGDVFTHISCIELERIKKAKVMVVGAGALGNEVLKNLALFGVGNIIVVDFDRIEESNLCRSVLFRKKDAEKNEYKAKITADRVKEINPEINIQYITGNIGYDVGLGLFREMDVIIGCLDNRLARAFINRNAFRANKPWIDGGIENLDGYVKVFKFGVNCYYCGLDEEATEAISRRFGCPDLALLNIQEGRIATTPVSSSIIAAIEVQEAIKIIHGYNESSDKHACNTLLGKMFKYEGMTMNTWVFDFSNYNDDCPDHEMWEPVIKANDFSADMTVEQALTKLQQIFQSKIRINLINNKFIVKLIPEISEKEIVVKLPESQIPDYIDNNKKIIGDSDKIHQEYISELDEAFPFKNLTLNAVGIPYLDVLHVETTKGKKYVELSGDRNKYALPKLHSNFD